MVLRAYAEDWGRLREASLSPAFLHQSVKPYADSEQLQVADAAKNVGVWNIINASVDRNTVEAQVFFGENRNVLYGVIEKHG